MPLADQKLAAAVVAAAASVVVEAFAGAQRKELWRMQPQQNWGLGTRFCAAADSSPDAAAAGGDGGAAVAGTQALIPTLAFRRGPFVFRGMDRTPGRLLQRRADQAEMAGAGAAAAVSSAAAVDGEGVQDEEEMASSRYQDQCSSDQLTNLENNERGTCYEDSRVCEDINHF